MVFWEIASVINQKKILLFPLVKKQSKLTFLLCQQIHLAENHANPILPVLPDRQWQYTRSQKPPYKRTRNSPPPPSPIDILRMKVCARGARLGPSWLAGHSVRWGREAWPSSWDVQYFTILEDKLKLWDFFIIGADWNVNLGHRNKTCSDPNDPSSDCITKAS